MTTTVVRYDAGQGPESHITLQWCKGIPEKDTTTRTVLPLTKPMCLSREEVRGQKVEREISLPPGSSNLNLIPGGVFASQELLRSGRFKYLNWEKRKSYKIHAESQLAKQTQATIATAAKGGISERLAIHSLHALTDPTNFAGTPNRSSSSEMCWSTFQECMGLNIGGSFFYMGLAGTKYFSFSSDRFRYLYVYSFDQLFLSAAAESPSQAADLLCDLETLSEDALFLLETKYGRRIYVIIESEHALEYRSNGVSGGLEWIVISAKLQQPSFASKAKHHIRIRLQAQDGNSLAVEDFSSLQSLIDDYFRSSCDENPIVPLSYKVSDLDGTSVSLLTTAFLDSQHCLTSPKARVQLREIKLCATDDKQQPISKEIYGSIMLNLYDQFGRQVCTNGEYIDLRHDLEHAAKKAISIASKEAPIKLSQDKPQVFGVNAKGKYIDVDITSLDMIFEFEPIIKESITARNHTFSTNSEPKKNLRQMLMEGSMGLTFQCQHDQHRLELTVEITPL
ncbi:MAG: hypothetical protein VKO39_00930 [Cyanobacteriota bacterium]|nr:hypothetical protein [Cyanobacteriota bacterium]